MTIPQLAFSLWITLILVMFALIIVGIIPFGPISDHVRITSVPGLSQVLAPVEQIQEGKEADLLNYEAIPGPDETAPRVTFLPTSTPVPTVREKQVIPSNLEPGLVLVYDPTLNQIGVTARGPVPGIPGTHLSYDVSVTSPEGVSSYLINSTPATLTIPGGATRAEVLISRLYPSGARIPVLQATV
jgi:hypothetical protein